MSVSPVSPRRGRYTEQQSRTHSWPGLISKHTLASTIPAPTPVPRSPSQMLSVSLSGSLAPSASVNKHSHFHAAVFPEQLSEVEK